MIVSQGQDHSGDSSDTSVQDGAQNVFLHKSMINLVDLSWIMLLSKMLVTCVIFFSLDTPVIEFKSKIAIFSKNNIQKSKNENHSKLSRIINI